MDDLPSSLGERRVLAERRRLRPLDRKPVAGRRHSDRSPSAAQSLQRLGHEIRTPLAAAYGLSDLLCRTALSHEQEKYVLALRDSVESVLSVVGSSLDQAAVTPTGRQTGHTDISIATLIDSVATLFAAEIRRKAMSLTIDVADSVADVRIDEQVMTRQVLVNLVSNAIRHAGTGEIALACESDSAAGDGGIRIEVRDSGPGIPCHLRERIFLESGHGMGRQGDGSRGSGLGLSIARDLVTSMGGEIGLECPAAGGSRFWFTLPRDRVVRRPAVDGGIFRGRSGVGIRTRGECQHGTADERRSALVVEDHEASSMVLRTTLEKLGYETVAVSTVDAATRICESQQFGAILVDWCIPGGGGIAAARRIRRIEQRGNARSTLMLVTAADLTASERDRVRAAGIDCLFQKPLTTAVLRSVLEDGTVPPVYRPHSFADGPDFDIRIISELAGLDGKRGRSLLETLLDETATGMPKWIEEIENAARNGDLPRVRSLSHDLAGLSRQLGAVRMAATCGRINAMRHTDDLLTVRHYLQRLAEEFRVFELALRDHALWKACFREGGVPVRSDVQF